MEEKYESSLRNPVTDVEISKLQLDIQKKLGNIELPKSYVVFLITVNGLDFNELVIYGVHEHLLVDQEVEDLQGFVDTNVFFTSLVNLFFYSGGLIGWTYYSFNADSGWDIETLILSGVKFTFLLIIIIYLNARKKHLIDR
ncbi:YrhA family protein [Cytobacillus firmus]|uniref:YrhA family protein n=1 Tax=Cytobacillus firmus TaxID=1399 RepID=UPI0030840704